MSGDIGCVSSKNWRDGWVFNSPKGDLLTSSKSVSIERSVKHLVSTVVMGCTKCPCSVLGSTTSYSGSSYVCGRQLTNNPCSYDLLP